MQQDNHTREDVLRFVTEYYDEHGISPTRQEISDAVGRALAPVQYHVDLLVEAGELTRAGNKARTLRPTLSKIDRQLQEMRDVTLCTLSSRAHDGTWILTVGTVGQFEFRAATPSEVVDQAYQEWKAGVPISE